MAGKTNALPLSNTNSDIVLPVTAKNLLIKARTSWLRNIEVLDLLTTYLTLFPVSKYPPDKPAGGTLFLFNRKLCRFFRKDGHSWRRKADGKTVRETHEKLKVENRDVLNCYYTHSDQKDGLQRRCYWLLDGDDNTVLVHYLGTTPARLQPAASGATSLASSTSSHGQVPHGAWGQLGRADSMPDNFGSNLAFKLHFTVTTGTHVQPLNAADAGTLSSSANEPQMRHAQAEDGWQDGHFGAYQRLLLGSEADMDHDFAGGSSVGIVAEERARSQPLAQTTFDDSLCLGPLHNAPSFSAGTVQTGSTIDATDQAALQRYASLSRSSTPDAFAGPALGQRSFSSSRSAGHVLPEPSEIDSPGSLPFQPGPPSSGEACNLQPAASLKRVDSDTLQEAPSISRATQGAASAPADGGEPPSASRRTWQSPFAGYASLPRQTSAPAHAHGHFRGVPVQQVGYDAFAGQASAPGFRIQAPPVLPQLLGDADFGEGSRIRKARAGSSGSGHHPTPRLTSLPPFQAPGSSMPILISMEGTGHPEAEADFALDPPLFPPLPSEVDGWID